MSVSCDSSAALRAFCEHCGVTDFPVLSDWNPKGRVSQLYGVYNEERGNPIRSVFLIDENGTIRWKKVYTEGIPDNEELLAALDTF